MTDKISGKADAAEWNDEDTADVAKDSTEGAEDEVGTAEGFASALCYLAFEAKRAGWHETHEYLEDTYSAFLDEVGIVRTRFRVYVNPKRH